LTRSLVTGTVEERGRREPPIPKLRMEGDHSGTADFTQYPDDYHWSSRPVGPVNRTEGKQRDG
jgi:hypothetical protein